MKLIKSLPDYWSSLLLLFCLSYTASSAAAGPAQVLSLNMTAQTGVVDVDLDLVNVDCPLLNFTAASGTLGEVYYTMLLTAQAIGAEVEIAHHDSSSATPCMVTQVKVIKP